MSITVENVAKRYGQVQALDSVSLRFDDGKIYGLLGRNGAGKSTLLSLIANRGFPDAGEIAVDGKPAQEGDTAQGKLYLMSEKTYYPENMRVQDAFRWTKNFYPDFNEEAANQLAERFGLETSKKVKGLSAGYLSIFKLVTALNVNVPHLLLDEPVLGLDANHREFFYKALLEKYGEKPFTVVLSTHLIEEAAGFLENVAILKGGKLLTACSTEELTAGYYQVSGPARAVEQYLTGREPLQVDSIGGLRTACVRGIPDRSNALDGLEFSRMDLQKLFILLTEEKEEIL